MAAKQLKGVILSVEDTLVNMGDVKQDVFEEVEKLMAYFKKRGIKPVLLANQQRWHTQGGVRRDLYEVLEERFDDLAVFTLAYVTLKCPQSLVKLLLNTSLMKWAGNLMRSCT